MDQASNNKAGGQLNGSPRQGSSIRTKRTSISKLGDCQDLRLIEDTREQQGWAEYFEAPCQRGTLKTGDYSISGYEDVIAIERKSLSDLIGCLTSGRERFQRELERAKELQFFCVIVEATYPQLVLGQYQSEMRPYSATESIATWEVRYGHLFLFCSNPEMSAYKCESLLRKFYREKWKNFIENIPDF